MPVETIAGACCGAVQQGRPQQSSAAVSVAPRQQSSSTESQQPDSAVNVKQQHAGDVENVAQIATAPSTAGSLLASKIENSFDDGAGPVQWRDFGPFRYGVSLRSVRKPLQ
jgi:hypothetical protein